MLGRHSQSCPRAFSSSNEYQGRLARRARLPPRRVGGSAPSSSLATKTNHHDGHDSRSALVAPSTTSCEELSSETALPTASSAESGCEESSCRQAFSHRTRISNVGASARIDSSTYPTIRIPTTITQGPLRRSRGVQIHPVSLPLLPRSPVDVVADANRVVRNDSSKHERTLFRGPRLETGYRRS